MYQAVGVIGGGGAATPKSVQRGTIALTGATSATATITSVDTANSRLIFGGRTYDNAAGHADQALNNLNLTNATTVTCAVLTSPGADTVTTAYGVSEHYGGTYKSIQRGTLTAGTATITSVDVAKASCEYLGETTAGAAALVNCDCKMVLTNATTVTLSVGAVATQTGRYQVPEFS